MSLQARSADYVNYLEEWLARLPTLELADVVSPPEEAAIMCVDIINGFCTIGPLSSPRIQAIVNPIASLFTSAYTLGVRHFILPQDTHDPQAIEFGQYPPHCVMGDPQSQTTPELMALPFSGKFVVIPKNSISSSQNTGLDTWLEAHPQLRTFVVTGDCSDLCTYQLAMHLRLRANAQQMTGVRVIVPANCVQTYDTSVEAAASLGIPPHPGDLLHAVFLHNMATNGIDVIRRLEY